jgi:hypothetical protein
MSRPEAREPRSGKRIFGTEPICDRHLPVPTIDLFGHVAMSAVCFLKRLQHC